MTSRFSWKFTLWAASSVASAAIFGFLGHTWLLAGIGSTVPSWFVLVAALATHGDLIGAEMIFRVIGAIFCALFEAMG